ncbi:TPA: hypothetical protein ACH3X1_014115 [Trebouxia sp. C0004]
MDQLSCSGQLTLNLTSLDGAVVGCAVRRNLQARQPVYVSVGHTVGLATACDIVHGCCLQSQSGKLTFWQGLQSDREQGLQHVSSIEQASLVFKHLVDAACHRDNHDTSQVCLA